MLLRIVAVITFLSAVSGLLKALLILRSGRRNSAISDAKLLEKTRKQMRRGWIVFWLSSSAFLFLVSGYATPVEILIALAISLAAILPFTFITGQLRPVSAVNGLGAPITARDAGTGERLGLVVGQVRDPRSDLVSRYKIKTKEGKLIETPADQVVIDFQR